MRLIRIDHTRCNEIDSWSYFGVPDGRADDDINQDIISAQNQYNKDRKDFDEKAEPPPNLFKPDILSYKDDAMTIGEAKALLVAETKAREAYWAARKKALYGFEHYMEELGYLSLYEMTENDLFEAYWGHRHGETLILGSNKFRF